MTTVQRRRYRTTSSRKAAFTSDFTSNLDSST
jgi:hypothetical protein